MFTGTLVTSGSNAYKLSGAGATMAMLELGWNSFETADGVYSQSYINSIKTKIAQFKAAGLKITLSLGLHYTPAWITAKPASKWIDHNGNVSNEFNMVDSQSMRDYVARFIAAVHAAFDLNTFAFIRLNSAGTPAGELMFPSTGGFWCYTTGAQNGADMPTGRTPNPLPGYKPGDTVTDVQRHEWLDWYIGRLAEIVDWQIGVCDGLGYRNLYQTVCPGQGVRPSAYETTITNNYAVTAGTLGLVRRGVVWHVIHSQIASAHRSRVYPHCSSVADKSGSPADNVTQPGDATTTVLNWSSNWSAVRLLVRIALEYGYPGVTGENPGWPNDGGAGNAHYLDLSEDGLLETTLRQAEQCGLDGLFWAHDDHVASGAIPLQRLASADTNPKTNRFATVNGARARRIS